MSLTVLIVDDSLTVRMDLAEAFEAYGCAAVPCSSVAEARQQLRLGPTDVIILDVNLPDGDGVELLREIRELEWGPRAVVLMLSTQADVKDRIRGLQTGADEYVGKPYDSDFVVAKARELARARKAEKSPQPLVLLIDDSPTVREEFSIALRAAGYLVLTAASGEEGLRLAADRRPAAVVVDGIMEGIDGATVIRTIRLDSALRATPCILLTATLDRAAELRILEAGADAFVHKEEPVEVLLARLAAILRGSAGLNDDSGASLLGPKRILTVDDSSTFLEKLSSALLNHGYEVATARSGEEALELLAVQQMDCILLDLIMPGMGGLETCRRIRSAPGVRDTPLILLTSQESRASMMEGLAAGADDYVAKSAEFEVLLARVRVQLRRKQFEDEKRRVHTDLLAKELEASQARSARELAEARAVLIAELEMKNKELEAFSYTVSHDLRAPLRAIDGFCAALQRGYSDKLDDQGRHYMDRVRAGSKRMGQLIDDLLSLSRISCTTLKRRPTDFTRLAEQVIEDLRANAPGRRVEVSIEPGMRVDADPDLFEVVLVNLLGNAWKYSSGKDQARIQIGQEGGKFYVRDNGAGFDMTYINKLFTPFQRLHSSADFEGTGIGLATVERIISRHRGKIWAESKPGEGATFFFTLSES